MPSSRGRETSLLLLRLSDVRFILHSSGGICWRKLRLWEGGEGGEGVRKEGKGGRKGKERREEGKEERKEGREGGREGREREKEGGEEGST